MYRDKILKYYVVGVGMYVVVNGAMFKFDKDVGLLCIEKKDASYECQQGEDNDLTDYLTPRLEISDTTNTSIVSMRFVP